MISAIFCIPATVAATGDTARTKVIIIVAVVAVVLGAGSLILPKVIKKK